MKMRFIAALLILLVFTFFGCSMRPKVTTYRDYASSKKHTFSETSTISQTSASSNTSVSSSSVPSSSAIASSSKKSSSSSKLNSSSTVVSMVNNYNNVSLQKGMEYNYKFEIIKGIKENSLPTSDFLKFDDELKWYGNAITNAPNHGYGGNFAQNSSDIIGDTAAIAKAKEYIQSVYDYKIPSDNTFRVDITRFDYTNSVVNEWMHYDRYYEISFTALNFKNNANQYYGAEINAQTGKAFAGKNYTSDQLPTISSLTSQIEKDMQNRAQNFVLNKNLVPGAKIQYTCSVIVNQNNGIIMQIETYVYMDNGTVVQILDSFTPGYLLNFHIFPTHGFRN